MSGAGMDPAALQVLIARLTGIATEMGAVLARSAFSPNIKERHDHSAALFTPAGELLVQAEHIPVHLGSMPASVAVVIERFGPGTDGWERVEAGAQVVLNDPFAGGTHLNDVTVVAACVVDGRLVGWVANRAHHADVGGAAPGSMPADAIEVFAEGLRLPPVLLTDEIVAVLCANSRTPDERRGDLDAQVGANRRGVERLAALADDPLDEVLVHGERRMRSALAALPDGEWTFVDVVDSFGPRPEQQTETHVARGRPGRGRHHHLRSDRQRPPAGRQRQCGAAGDRERGDLRPALRAASGHPGQRGCAAAGHRAHRTGHDRRCPRARRRRRRQRRGQPAGRRPVPRCARPGGARTARRRLPGHHEQPADGRHRRRRPGVGVLRDRRRRAGRPGPGTGHERRAHGDDQQRDEATPDRSSGCRVSREFIPA